MSSRLIDLDVVKRLIKAMDLALFGAVAITSTVTLAKPAAADQQFTAAYLSLILVLATMLAMRSLGLYEPLRWRNHLDVSFRTTALATLIGLGCLVTSRFTPLSLDPFWLVWWTSFFAAYALASRWLIGCAIGNAHAMGRFSRRVAIVGGGTTAEHAAAVLESSDPETIQVIGLFDDRDTERDNITSPSRQKIGTVSELASFARTDRVDLIVVAIPLSAEKRLLHILKNLWELPVDIRISAAATELKFSPKAYSYLGQLPLLNVFDRPLSGWDSFLKSCLDRTLALIMLILLAPVFLATALAVKLDSKGSVFFKQKRFGFNNQMVDVYKFRSLRSDHADFAAAKQVTKDDPRVTRVGRFIRKASIDELPQLFNVLKGELSLVGPRPHATQAKAAGTLYDEVVEGYFARHKVKPGITGWAQINGWRGETDTVEKIQQRVKHDLEYIDRWSLGLDLYILVKTPISLLKSENAY